MDDNKETQNGAIPPDVTKKMAPITQNKPKTFSANNTKSKRKPSRNKKAVAPKAGIPETKTEAEKNSNTPVIVVPLQTKPDNSLPPTLKEKDLSGLSKSNGDNLKPEESKPKEPIKPTKEKTDHKHIPYGIIVACVSAVAAVCLICVISAVYTAARYDQTIQTITETNNTAQEPARYYEQETPSSSSSSSSSVAVEHTHDFQPVYTTVHHDATYATVHHDATYKSVEKNHTVCNECQTVCDTEQDRLMHTAKTGHKYFTASVPIAEQVEDQPAWDEQVIDQAAYDEQIITGYKCSCGEEKPAS